MKFFHRFCAVVCATAISSTLLAQDNAATPKPGNTQAPAGNQVDAAAVERATTNVRKAISVLIPGGIAEGTPRGDQFGSVIDKFGRGLARDAMDDLEKMCAADSELPPAEIIMAGLTFAVGDNKSGIALLESSAIKTPDYPGVYLSFAQLALNGGRVTDASLHADKTAKLIESGNLTPAQKDHFLKQYYEIASTIFSRRKQDSQADKMLELLQALAPNRPFYFYSKAELAFRAGKNEVALDFLKKHAQSIESKNLPELTLVDWLKNTGKTDSAEQLLVDTVTKNPNDATAQMTIARMHMAKENFPDAESAIKKFEQINGGEVNQSVDMKGRIAFAGGNYELAEAHFRNLNARTPNDPSTMNIYALSLVERNEAEKQKLARQLSGRVAERIPNNPLALASFGYICLKSGDKPLAQKLMQRVAMSRQATPEISYLLANWLVDTGQTKQAIDILKQAVDSKGLFLYRSESRRLLAKLQSQQ